MENFTYGEVLDILKQFTNKPEETIEEWNINKSNTPIGERLENYIFSFPIIKNNEEVATITLAKFYGYNLNCDNIMLKYLGYEGYNNTFKAFSHNDYINSYLTIHKEFSLDNITEGLYGEKQTSIDSKGNKFNFTVAYGMPSNEGDDYLYYQWLDKGYRFDNGVSIKIEDLPNGWKLSDKINENIIIRLRNKKINNIVKL